MGKSIRHQWVKHDGCFFLGKAVMQRLTQSSVKYQAHSSETVTKWGKLGGWNAAKNDFRDIVKQAAPGSVKTLTDASGRVSMAHRAVSPCFFSFTVYRQRAVKILLVCQYLQTYQA